MAAKKIFLAGLPGCGKSTLGRELAMRLQRPFVDLDTEIEKHAGELVAQIFSRQGELAFRQMERQLLLAFCQAEKTFVMATGGGAPCFEDNMDVMRAAGTVIFLDVPPSEIARRIALQTQQRPLLKHETPDSLKDRIEFLRSQRIRFYEKAHAVAHGGHLDGNALIALLEPER